MDINSKLKFQVSRVTCRMSPAKGGILSFPKKSLKYIVEIIRCQKKSESGLWWFYFASLNLPEV